MHVRYDKFPEIIDHKAVCKIASSASLGSNVGFHAVECIWSRTSLMHVMST